MSETRVFSGDASREFWGAIKRAKYKKKLLYDYGCKAQEIEAHRDKLLAALKPFAKLADLIPKPDGTDVEWNKFNIAVSNIQLEDLHEAKAAIKED